MYLFNYVYVHKAHICPKGHWYLFVVICVCTYVCCVHVYVLSMMCVCMYLRMDVCVFHTWTQIVPESHLGARKMVVFMHACMYVCMHA